MPTIQLRAHPTQIAFLKSPARFRGYIGGIGSGKTTVGSMAAVMESQSPSLGMIVAPTFPMLRDSTLRTFQEIAGPAIRHFKQTEMIAEMQSGAEILFRSGDDPERLRGPNLKWLWIDEAALVAKAVWMIGMGRLRLPGARGWITTTPKGKAHWTYEEFGTDKSDHALFISKTSDNPFLDPDYLPSLQRNYTGAFARQELGGEFVAPEGALFQREWFQFIDPDDARLREVIRWVRAWDLALTTKESSDRTASLCVGYDPLANLYLADGIAGKWEWPEVRPRIVHQALADGPGVPIVVEKTAFQLAAVQELYRIPELIGFHIIGDEPDKDKIARLRPLQARAANGRVYLVRGNWTGDFLDEITSIVADMSHEHDDYGDAWSAGVKHLAEPKLAERLRRPAPPRLADAIAQELGWT